MSDPLTPEQETEMSRLLDLRKADGSIHIPNQFEINLMVMVENLSNQIDALTRKNEGLQAQLNTTVTYRDSLARAVSRLELQVKEIAADMEISRQIVAHQGKALQWYEDKIRELYYELKQARIWARMWKRAATVLFMVPYRDDAYCFRYIRFVKDQVVKPARNGIERWWERGHVPLTFFNRHTNQVEVKHD